MFCKKCGAELVGSGIFCRSCGTKQDAGGAPPVQAEPVYAPPVQASPVYAEPVYAPPMQEAPVYSPPVYAEPVQAEPAYAPLVQADPVQADPVPETQQARQTETAQTNAAVDDPGTDYSNPREIAEGKIKIKFPIAAISILLTILLGVAMYYIQTYFYSIYGMDVRFGVLRLANYLSFAGSTIISTFVLAVLLLKRRGAPLTATVCALAVWPIVITAADHILRYFIDFYPFVPFYYIYTFLVHVPLLLLLLLAIYCNKNKDSQKKRIIPKLWFIPGIISAALFAFFISEGGLSSQFNHFPRSYFVLDTLSNVLPIITVFLLGRWISYIYSRKHIRD